MVELGEGASALPGLGEEPDQRRVGLFVDRFGGHQPLERRDRRAQLAALLVALGELAEQGQVAGPQGSSPPLGPLLVGVLRQQVAAVVHEGGMDGGRVRLAPGQRRGLLEGVDVDPDLAGRTEEQPLAVADEEGIGRGAALLQPAAGLVEDEAQVTGGGVRVVLRPERLDQLFAMETVGRGQRQQLDDGRRSLAPPRRRRHGAVADGDGKAAEQAHLQAVADHRLHRRSFADRAPRRPPGQTDAASVAIAPGRVKRRPIGR